MLAIFRAFGAEETGATAIEYALIAALVAMALIASLTALGTSLQNIFGSISNQLNSVAS